MGKHNCNIGGSRHIPFNLRRQLKEFVLYLLQEVGVTYIDPCSGETIGDCSVCGGTPNDFLASLPSFVGNSAALAGGLQFGDFYIVAQGSVEAPEGVVRKVV